MYGGTKFEFKKANNLPAASPYPLIEELAKLESIDPRTFVKNVRTFLSKYGVTKVPALKYYKGSRYKKDPSDECPSIFLLGNPYCFVRKMGEESRSIVVSQVWNRRIDAWGRLTRPGLPKEFTEKSIYQGFYDGDASRWPTRWQYWIHKEDVADVIFNKSRGLFNTDDGIFLNTHQQGFRKALFHEIFHAFESQKKLSVSSFFAEGFAEYFAIMFGAAKPYNLKIDVFPQYREQFKAVKALIDQTVLRCKTAKNDIAKSRRLGLEICIKAFYGDDMGSLEKLLPMFDDDLRKKIPKNDRLSEAAVEAGMAVNCIKDRVTDPNKKEKDWYREWQSKTV